ncbi:hypothetical protein N9E34_03710 [Opitutales bacterium]|nr:hypothetical protein [Opitutales bacterium]
MSFSYASDVITQTGTDTDLSGLEGKTGVTVIRLGGSTDQGGIISHPIVYQLTKQLVVEGDLTFDANGESLILISGQNAIIVKSGGSLNISALYQGTPTRALAINANISQTGAFWQTLNSTLTAEAGSSVDFEGITIGAQQNLFLDKCNGTIKNCVIIGDDDDEPLIKIGENISIDGLEVIGTHGLILGSNNDMVIKNVTVKSSTKVTQHDGTGWNWTKAVPSFPTFEDYTSNGGSQIDFRMWWNGGYKVTNSATGSDLNNKQGGSVGAMYGNGFVWLTKKLSLNYSDSSGTAISGVKTRINDFDNSSRRSLQSVGDGYTLLVNTTPDFSTDLTYSSTSDSSGDSAELEVTTAVWTGSKNDSTIDGQWDYRSKNNGNDDIFDIAHADYNYLISVSTVALKGLGTLNIPVVLFSDSSLTESDKDTVDAYTEIDTPQKFYDRAKSYLVDNFTGEAIPLVSKDGNTINAGSYDVVVDASASSVFAISGNTLTIKASTFTGNILTDGTATLSNDAVVIGTFKDTTVLQWEIQNIEATSRLQLYNVTKDAVVITQKLTGIAYNKTILLELAGHTYAVALRHGGAFIDATSVEVIASGDASSSWTLQSGVVQFNVGSGVLGSALTQDDADINVDLIQGHEDNTVTATATINSSEFNDEAITNSSGNVDTSGTYTSSEIATGDVVRLRVTCVVGATAMLPLEVTGVASSSGLSFSISQEEDSVYNTNGIDGSALTVWTADFSNTPMGVDLSEADGVATVQEIYAFMVHSQTSINGVDKWFNVVRAIDGSNYQVDQAIANIKIQNLGTVAVNITGGRIFRKDGASVLHAEDGNKPLSLDTGALVANIQPQLESALNSNAKISSTNNNSKLIPSLL